MTTRPEARAIVLIDHGSRRDEANEQLEELARRIRARQPQTIVQIAHLEIVPPNLGEAIDACVAAGATTVVVQPYFLASGRHTSEDIPRLVDSASARHPTLRLQMSAPLGIHDKLVDVVLARVEESGSSAC